MGVDVLNPTKILSAAGVTEKTVIADFGCGPGIFALPAAQMTRAKVYCFDILPTAVEALESKARTMHIVNVHARRVNLEAPGATQLSEHSTDLVIMRKILCQGQDNSKLFAEAARILRADGAVLVIGWAPEAVIGPPVDARLRAEEIAQTAQDAGFARIEELPCDDQHFAVLIRK